MFDAKHAANFINLFIFITFLIILKMNFTH